MEWRQLRFGGSAVHGGAAAYRAPGARHALAAGEFAVKALSDQLKPRVCDFQRAMDLALDRAGDREAARKMLAAQAVTLDGVLCELTRRGSESGNLSRGGGPLPSVGDEGPSECAGDPGGPSPAQRATAGPAPLRLSYGRRPSAHRRSDPHFRGTIPCNHGNCPRHRGALRKRGSVRLAKRQRLGAGPDAGCMGGITWGRLQGNKIHCGTAFTAEAFRN